LKSKPDQADPTEAVAEQAPVVSDLIRDVEETDLNLTLKGVILSSISENSEAIIGHGREEKFYLVGAKLPVGNNVRLVQVQTDQVILENNGRNEALRLFEPNDSVTSAPATNRARDISLNRINRNPREIFDEELERAGVDPSNLNVEEEEPTPQNRRVVSQAPKSLAEVIKFSVERENGEVIGFKIRPGRNRDAFTQLGLEPNDIVTEINGVTLDNSGAISQVYREIREATNASISLLRDGQTQSLNITLEDNSEE
jgi:general secretion pathway protein C